MDEYEKHLKNTGEIGQIFSVTNSLVYASGLPQAKVGEKVITEKGEVGIVQALGESSVEILMITNKLVEPGSKITRTGGNFTIPVGEGFLGRTIDPLGNSIDKGNPVIQSTEVRDIQPEVAGIRERTRVTQPITTGVTVVDTLIPLGRGQRESIIGDSKSGKTSFLLQAVLSQKDQDVICIYVAIGKKKMDIKKIEDFLIAHELQKYTTLIASDAGSYPGIIYLAPFSGMALAEYFRDKGKDVLIVFDDLTAHAKSYREIALQGKKSPGREGYPGDIYFLHSRLLERGGRFILPAGQTPSITVFCVVQSITGDFTGLIPTNIMSMTDGHVYFDTDLMQRGQLPAVDVFLSVSRVGNQTRSLIEKEISMEIRNYLSQYRATLVFSRFGVELSEASKNLIRIGEKINAIFSQDQFAVVSAPLQLIIFALLVGGFWDSKQEFQVEEDKEKLAKAYQEGKLKNIEAEILKLKDLTAVKDYVRAKYSEFLKVTG